jgi:cyclopropane fatty-acyl-phospholipid synthase-like methyltransferase
MTGEPVPDPEERRRFLDRRREICRERFDTLHAPAYDERWGSYLNPTHERCVRNVISQLPAGARVLDAACGTGKYWPLLLDAALEVVGTDQSQAMLDVAHAKHPDVTTYLVALQDLADAGLPPFDAVLCVDAIENVGPEDWPGVVAGLRGLVRPGGAAYLTVELPDPDDVHDTEDTGGVSTGQAPLVPGEVLSDGAYHYYPSIEGAVAILRDAGFSVDEVVEGDGYAHLLMRA